MQVDHPNKGRKLQEHTKTLYPPGLNIATAKYSSIISGLNQKAAGDEDSLLLGKESLTLDPEGDDITPLSGEDSLTVGNVYTPWDESFGASIETGHTSALKGKNATSILTQSFNANHKK